MTVVVQIRTKRTIDNVGRSNEYVNFGTYSVCIEWLKIQNSWVKKTLAAEDTHRLQLWHSNTTSLKYNPDYAIGG